MKKTLALTLGFVMLCTVTAPVFAADPDFFTVDSARQTIVPQDDWQPVGDGYSDGMGYFPDLGMLIYWLYGKHMFGW